MKIQNIEEAKKLVAENLISQIERKELIIKCLKHLNLSDEVLKDKKPGGELNLYKCLIGNAIAELVKSGLIVQEGKIIKLNEFEKSDGKIVESVKREIDLEKIIFDILENGKIEKKKLLAKIVQLYNKNHIEEKASVLKADAGRLLSSAVKNNKIVKDENCYTLFHEPINESKIDKNKRLFYDLSEEDLVDKTVLMLEQWYSKVGGYGELVSENIDGPDDGGIDGTIKGKDRMGSPENIIIQVKKINSRRKHLPLCEIREFYGVFASEKEATKAVFVTNSKYHKTAKAFLSKTKYLILIDGERWLQLAEECGFELS